MQAGCGHLSNSPTLSNTTHPFLSFALCKPCKLREGVAMAAYFLKCAQRGSPPGEFDGGLYFQTWRHTRLALANYLCEAHGTDGCSEEDDGELRWTEMARLRAANLDPDVLTEEEKLEEPRERIAAARRARDESRAAAFALADAASSRKKRRRTRTVADGSEDNDEANIEAGMSTPHDSNTTQSTPEPTGNTDTTHPTATTLATTPAIRPNPLPTILKTPKKPDTTAPNPLNLNFDAISISPTQSPTNKNKPNFLRTVTIHPTATVQATPTPYPHPHRPETEYRNDAFYNRTSGIYYEPGQWALVGESPTSGKKGKKRQREEDDEDGDESTDWQYKGAVFTTEEVVKLGKGKQLRAKRS
jgi:hypothetical protein